MEQKIIRVMPDYVLLIGNVGEIPFEQREQIFEYLRTSIPSAKKIVLFAEDIDVRKLNEGDFHA